MTSGIHIPLAMAALCLDCRHVSDSLTRCPCCASEALLPLASLLDRETQDRTLEIDADGIRFGGRVIVQKLSVNTSEQKETARSNRERI